MRVGDDKASARLFILEETEDGDMILREDAIEHMVCLLEIGTLHCEGIELDEMLLDQGVPRAQTIST